MFSGIIEHQAKILERKDGLFTVENHFIETDLKIGQSIAHDGACMTLTNISPASYQFFVMQESLNVSSLGKKTVWDSLNVERSLLVSDRVDGHFVTGHIDTVWTVLSLEEIKDGSKILTIHFPEKYSSYTIRKGSITINGVSLTIVDDEPWTISVSIIPLTQEITNLWKLQKGDTVNLEFDMMGKYVAKLLWKTFDTVDSDE